MARPKKTKKIETVEDFTIEEVGNILELDTSVAASPEQLVAKINEIIVKLNK